MLPLKPTLVAGREDWGARGVGGQPDLRASPPCVLTVPACAENRSLCPTYGFLHGWARQLFIPFLHEAEGLAGAGSVNEHQVLLPEAITVIEHVIKRFHATFHIYKGLSHSPLSLILLFSSLWLSWGIAGPYVRNPLRWGR